MTLTERATRVLELLKAKSGRVDIQTAAKWQTQQLALHHQGIENARREAEKALEENEQETEALQKTMRTLVDRLKKTFRSKGVTDEVKAGVAEYLRSKRALDQLFHDRALIQETISMGQVGEIPIDGTL